MRISVEIDIPEDILGLAARVYEGLSEQEVNEVERIALDRSAFFTKPLTSMPTFIDAAH